MTWDGIELTNSIEWVEWKDGDDDIQVQICETCGTTHCATGGYASISRLGSFLLWTGPTHRQDDAFSYGPASSVARRDSLLIPVASWDHWRQRVKLPTINVFPRSRRLDLALAWAWDAKGPGHVEDISLLPDALIGKAYASDHWDAAETLAALGQLVAWVKVAPDEQPDVKMERASPDFTLETVYFDGPEDLDWTAIAWRNSELTFAFREDWVVLPPVTAR
jgi:hypothetical protein